MFAALVAAAASVLAENPTGDVSGDVAGEAARNAVEDVSSASVVRGERTAAGVPESTDKVRYYPLPSPTPLSWSELVRTAATVHQAHRAD
jgi:hypothetical protein